MKHPFHLVLFLLLAASACAAEEGETLVQLDKNLRAGGFVFRVRAIELKHDQVLFHILISGDDGHLPNAPSPRTRLGFFNRDHGERIGHLRDVEMKRQGQSLAGNFTLHAGWLFGSSLCFVLTSQPEGASAPPISYYLRPTDSWEPDRDLNADYEVMRVYHKTPDFLSFVAGDDEIAIDLNGDGRTERLLLGISHGRWGHYSIFTYRDHKWQFIGDARLAERPRVEKRARGGWHDFTGEVGGPRNQLFRRYYHWDTTSHEYEEASETEIRPMESDPSIER